nr:PREDICTED: uncharacterized protein LOC109038138 [Bemisia tabaci]
MDEATETFLRKRARRAADPTSGISDAFTVRLVARFRRGHDSTKACNDAALTRFNDSCRLLAAARHLSPDSINSLSDCIDPRNYAVVLGAAKNVTGFDAATHRVENPGTVDRLLALLRDAVSLKREETATSSVLPEESKRDLMEQCRRFDDLLSSAWPVDIGKHAQATTLQRRCSNPPQIPVSADIHALFREATSMVARSTALLEFQVTEKNFVQLSEALLAALVIYNGRRASEVSGAPFNCYRNRPTGEALQKELRVVPILDRAVGVRDALLEDQSGRPEFFLVPGGKNKRPVAIIVPRSLLPGIDRLNATRDALMIPPPTGGTGGKRSQEKGKKQQQQQQQQGAEEAGPSRINDLLFPRPGSTHPYDVVHIIRRLKERLAKDRRLQRPELLTTRTIRTRLATMASELPDRRDAEALNVHLDHSEATSARYYKSADPTAAPRAFADVHRDPRDDPVAKPATRRPEEGSKGSAEAPPTQTGIPAGLARGIAQFGAYAAAETILASIQKAPSPARRRRAVTEVESVGGGRTFRVSYCVEDEPETSGRRTAPQCPSPTGSVPGHPSGVKVEDDEEVDAPTQFRRWTQSETDQLKEVFHEFLVENRIPTRAEILTRIGLGMCPQGRSLASIRGQLFKIRAEAQQNR